MVTLSCSECGKTRTKDVSKFIKHEAQVKLRYKCSCRRTSSVILERRRYARKDVCLNGYIIQESGQHAILIEDLSRHGFRIKLLKEIVLEEGEIFEIKFILDDPNRSEVSKKIRVLKINSPTNISCEFLNKDHQGDLGKYFLFYF